MFENVDGRTDDIVTGILFIAKKVNGRTDDG